MAKKIILFVLFPSILFSMKPHVQQGFKANQKTYARVKTAYLEKLDTVKNWLKQKNIDISTVNIFLRAFKKEGLLEVWAKNKSETDYKLVQTINICEKSGVLGPKRKQGDGQVPEGFYFVDRFNPTSNFYLSLGINYPNESDKILGVKGKLGGDVFIHGSCVTIGCLPITDDKIKELYILAVEAKNSGQNKIPVDIYPCKLEKEGMDYLEKTGNTEDVQFWKNLKEGYDWFEKKKAVPKIYVDKKGKYSFG